MLRKVIVLILVGLFIGANVILNVHSINLLHKDNPPNIPSNPSPVNHSTDVSINATLSWTGGDPDANDTVSYDVFFGSSMAFPLVSHNQSGTTYNPGIMMPSTQYWWRICAWDNKGASTWGPIWDFTTGPIWNITIISGEKNHPPYIPSNPSPANHTTDYRINNASLSWTGGDPDTNDTVSYDVYFGMTNQPTKVSGNQSDNAYYNHTLNYTTTYYWRIVAWDNHGASTMGPIWDFTTTGSIIVVEHNPPGPLTIYSPGVLIPIGIIVIIISLSLAFMLRHRGGRPPKKKTKDWEQKSPGNVWEDKSPGNDWEYK